MEEYAREMGIKLKPVTPKDPQANGFVENFVKTICKLLHTCAAEDKNPQKELNRFLLQYRAAPHLTTDRSPAEMLFNRRIRTKLPQFPSKEESKDKQEVRRTHDAKKLKQKAYFDKGRRAYRKKVSVGDKVLIQQQSSTTDPPFNPNPLTVTKVTGNQVTATDGNVTRKRDKNQVKVLRSRPEHLQASWEKSAVNTQPDPVIDYDFAQVESQSEQADEDPCSSAQPEPENHAQPEPVRLDANMNAHMAQLIERAERNRTEHPTMGTRTLRSARTVLTWNPEMNADNPVLDGEDNL